MKNLGKNSLSDVFRKGYFLCYPLNQLEEEEKSLVAWSL